LSAVPAAAIPLPWIVIVVSAIVRRTVAC